MNNKHSKTAKQAYNAPALVTLGAISDLTAAGSQQTLIEQGNPGNCSQDTNRNNCIPFR
jgi:hypothetical protein